VGLFINQTLYLNIDRAKLVDEIDMLQQLARSMLVDVDDLEYELVKWWCWWRGSYFYI
jgi:hypothetical protein